MSDTYGWFSHSHLRQAKYQELYGTIEVGEEPLKILRLCDTRWLSIRKCVERILDQFDVLKLHFQLIRDQEKCLKAGVLYDMYRDEANKLFLVFLLPWLQDLNRVNKLFQHNTASSIKLVQDLISLYTSVVSRICRPHTFRTWANIQEYDVEDPRNQLPTMAINFGTNFYLELDKMSMSQDKLKDVKQKCRNYMLELAIQLKKRLPENART